MATDKDLYRINHILESIDKIEKIANNCENLETFENKWIEQDAMIRNFEIIGEASNHLSRKLKEEHPEIEWAKIVGMRNLIAHEYFGVSPKVIWNTAVDIIPDLRKRLARIKDSSK